MQEVFSNGKRLLEEGKSFVYAAIISKKGSAPSGVGARMLVTEDEVFGTIGGGGVEADIIDYARRFTLRDKKPVIKYYNLNSEEAAVSEFICGGETEILLAYIDAGDKDNQEIFEKAEDAVLGQKKAWFVYCFNGGAEDGARCSVILNVENEGIFGKFEEGSNVKREMLANPVRIAVQEEADREAGRRYIVDSLENPGHIYLMGGGHVSLEVAKLAVGLEFRVTVIDDREEYANSERFSGCDCLVVDSFDNLPDLEVNSNTYILIITRGHAGDKSALKWAVDKNAGYLGMIGSKSKRDKIYDMLVSEGVDRDKLSGVHCPIGLQIGAKTPQEIGVSIVAELIKERRLEGQK